MPKPVLVSACLLGLHTRYDDTEKQDQTVLAYLAEQNYLPIPVCPEQLSGLPTPREAVQFSEGDGNDLLNGQGRVATQTGTDLTDLFLRGAEQTLKIAQMTGCHMAILKERSPSCGVNRIYRANERVPGQGVTAALLQREGLNIFSEEDLATKQDGKQL